MKKIIIGIVLGIAFSFIILSAKGVYSGNAEKIASFDYEYDTVVKIHDGNTKCYIVVGTGNGYGISCVRIK